MYYVTCGLHCARNDVVTHGQHSAEPYYRNVVKTAWGGNVTGHRHTAWVRNVSCQHNPQQHTTQNLIPICPQHRARSRIVTPLTHSQQSAPHIYQVHTRSPHPLLSSPFCTSHGRPTYCRSCHTRTDARVRLGELPACTAKRRHSSSLPSFM